MARRTGKDASLYYNGVKIADAYDCTVNISPKFIEHAAWGDKWQGREKDIGDWSVDAKRFSAVGGSLGAFLDMVATEINADTDVAVTIIVYQKDLSATTRIIEGPVWCDAASLALARGGMVDENIKFVSAGAPTFVIGG